MSKRVIYLIVGILIISISALASYFLVINDTYQKEYQTNSISLTRDYISKVSGQLPLGWRIVTYNNRMPYQDTMYQGLTDIVIYDGLDVIFYLEAVGDTGGVGGIYYQFTDSDPSLIEQYTINSENVIVKQVNDDQYTSIELFGLETRRIGTEIVPNVSEDKQYFTNPLSPILFTFPENGPTFDIYTIKDDGTRNLEQKGISTYFAYINPNSSSDQLEKLDLILPILKLK